MTLKSFLVNFRMKLLIAFKSVCLIHCDVLINKFIDLFVHVVADLSAHDSSVTENYEYQKYQESDNSQNNPHSNM